MSATKAPNSSGVAAINCTLNQQASTYTNAGDPDSQTVKVTVEPPGGDLSCKAQDNAGNWSTARAWNFLIDDTVPTATSCRPTRAIRRGSRLQAADAVSGVGGAQIEIQTATGWRQPADQLRCEHRDRHGRRFPTTAA